jgi:hypothetical protein
MRRKVACCAAVLAVACAWTAAASGSHALQIQGPYGVGTEQVWLLRPAGTPQSVVVFGHGYKHGPPVPTDAWVRQFEPWLTHLVADGNIVIFPRYQYGGEVPGPARLVAYRRGLTTAFARVDRSLPVVVFGYSYGATLGVTYASNAARWGLPRPRAVDAVFPAGLIPGVPLPKLEPAVRVLVQVGDDDTLAGEPGAAPILAWLRGHGRTRYVHVHSSATFVTTHAAPKATSAAARTAFWVPLDGLIARARIG